MLGLRIFSFSGATSVTKGLGMNRIGLFGMVLASLALLVGEVKATEHTPKVGHCTPAITVGLGLGLVRAHHNLKGEFVADLGGAVACRVARRFEFLLEVAIGPIMPNFEGFEGSLTAAILYEPHRRVRVGGAVMPSFLVGGPHTGGGLLMGPAAQITLIPGVLDLMAQIGPKLYFPDLHIGAEALVHLEFPFDFGLH